MSTSRALILEFGKKKPTKQHVTSDFVGKKTKGESQNAGYKKINYAEFLKKNFSYPLIRKIWRALAGSSKCSHWIYLSKFIGNNAKGRISKRVFQENSTPNFSKN